MDASDTDPRREGADAVAVPAVHAFGDGERSHVGLGLHASIARVARTRPSTAAALAAGSVSTQKIKAKASRRRPGAVDRF